MSICPHAFLHHVVCDVTTEHVILVFGPPNSMQNFTRTEQKLRPQEHGQTERQKDESDFIICLMLCYHTLGDHDLDQKLVSRLKTAVSVLHCGLTLQCAAKKYPLASCTV